MGVRPSNARVIREERARERLAESKRMRESDDERRQRVSQIVGLLHNSILPNYPVDMLDGFRLFWGVVNNPRDTVESRLRAGYQVVQWEEIPEAMRDPSAIGQKSEHGRYGNAICIAEHILLKIPVELWEDIMWHEHHDVPYSFLTDMIAEAQELADQHRGGRVTISDDMVQDANKRYETPTFS